jgi:hypothetical protein
MGIFLYTPFKTMDNFETLMNCLCSEDSFPIPYYLAEKWLAVPYITGYRVLTLCDFDLIRGEDYTSSNVSSSAMYLDDVSSIRLSIKGFQKAARVTRYATK